MATARSVVLNGEPGSGKSTVSRLLARRLGIRRVSVGDLYREMAQQRGMTALELNLHAELDDEIDHYVDQLQSDIAMSGETVVVDSRLAWHFFREALKVHLIADPMIAAHRVMSRPANTVESYASATEARARLAERSESERVRFLQRYGADKTRLRNYDLVCDSTSATTEEIVARIIEALAGPPPLDGRPRLYIDPRRIHPSIEHGTGTGPIRLGYARPDFFVVNGHREVHSAARDGHTLVQADLVAEADETIDDCSAETYYATHYRPTPR